MFLDIRLLCLSLTFRGFARATIPTASCWAFVYHFDMFLQIILKMGTEIALITKQILFLPYVSLQNVLWHQGGRQQTSIVPLRLLLGSWFLDKEEAFFRVCLSHGHEQIEHNCSIQAMVREWLIYLFLLENYLVG